MLHKVLLVTSEETVLVTEVVTLFITCDEHTVDKNTLVLS
jgi:hypothetical protein